MRPPFPGSSLIRRTRRRLQWSSHYSEQRQKLKLVCRFNRQSGTPVVLKAEPELTGIWAASFLNSERLKSRSELHERILVTCVDRLVPGYLLRANYRST